MNKALIALLVLAATALPAAANSIVSPQKTIGTLASVDYRIVVTTRRAAGNPPAATVEVATSHKQGGRWRPGATRTLAGPFFWNVVSGPNALCGLSISTAGGRAKPHATVRLLASPSLGCGRAYTIAL